MTLRWSLYRTWTMSWRSSLNSTCDSASTVAVKFLDHADRTRSAGGQFICDARVSNSAIFKLSKPVAQTEKYSVHCPHAGHFAIVLESYARVHAVTTQKFTQFFGEVCPLSCILVQHHRYGSELLHRKFTDSCCCNQIL